jgi:prepilin-type N-terminal cleavage/methylation domain-containing protein
MSYRRDSASERGFSLTEVMVASLVMLLVMGALYTGLEQAEVFYESYESSMTLRQQARVTMATMAGELRAAGYEMGDATDPVSIAGSNELQFTGDIDNGSDDGPCGAAFEGASGGGAERITYSVDDGNNLVRSIDCFDGSSWTTGVETATVLTGLQPDLDIFEYLDISGMVLPLDSGALSASLRADVRAVEINLVLQNAEQTVGAGNEIPQWFRIAQHVRLNNLESLDDLQ